MIHLVQLTFLTLLLPSVLGQAALSVRITSHVQCASSALDIEGGTPTYALTSKQEPSRLVPTN